MEGAPLNNSPLLMLRSQNRSFKARQKQLDKRVRNKNKLREEIMSNHDIFHSNINLYRNKTAQNIIWDKNYTFKCLINQTKEHNSSLRARIWNMEKENRKMERQIEAWSLTDYVLTTKKPYIDMATVETVLKDQDFNIVSLKIEIGQLQKILQSRDLEYESRAKEVKEVTDILRVLNHQLAANKVQVYRCFEGDTSGKATSTFQMQSKEKMSRTLVQQRQQLQLIGRNLEIKKKAKTCILAQLAQISLQLDSQGGSEAQLQRVAAQTLQLRAQEDGGINLQVQKVGLARKATNSYECFMQQQMDAIIATKIPLQLELETMKRDLGAARANNSGQRPQE